MWCSWALTLICRPPAICQTMFCFVCIKHHCTKCDLPREMSLWPIYEQAFFWKQHWFPRFDLKCWNPCLALTLTTTWLLNSLVLLKLGRPDVHPGRGWGLPQGKRMFTYLCSGKSQPLVICLDSVGARETLRLVAELEEKLEASPSKTVHRSLMMRWKGRVVLKFKFSWSGFFFFSWIVSLNSICFYPNDGMYIIWGITQSTWAL